MNFTFFAYCFIGWAFGLAVALIAIAYLGDNSLDLVLGGALSLAGLGLGVEVYRNSQWEER